MNALHQKDAYKIGHVHQYAPGSQYIYANFTARNGTHSNIPGTTGVVFVGLQYFILDYLIKEWRESFFDADIDAVAAKYRRRVVNILGRGVDISHIYALHELGYLPLKIKALPEGSFVPYGVPMLTVVNTHPDFYWATNMIESVMSSELWLPITSATTYSAYRRLFNHYALLTGAEGIEPFQGHDFSMRGMAGRHAAAISGFATLAAGSYGTDTVAAIDIAEEFYGADSDKEIVGVSVPATEHSVMCSGSKENELATYERLLTGVYPDGIVSVVSDTWDFWGVITEFLPKLKPVILGRDGKLVIRPDSGDPVKILCGDPDAETGSPEHAGLISLLWDMFGGAVNDAGYKVLDSHIGAIYGDSITYLRAAEILSILEEKGFASSNVILGIGSYTYQLVSRDTHGMAMKTTNAVINSKSIPLFKDPKTDNGVKKSARGLIMVAKEGDLYKLVDGVSEDQERHGCLKTVFYNGDILHKTTLGEIRQIRKQSQHLL